MLRTIPDGFEAGSDIANMSILGYAPELYYTGRGPLEAMNMGIDLDQGDVAYRCNLVTVENSIMKDFSAGHISSPEGAELFSSLGHRVPGVMFRPGVSYRNLIVVHEGNGSITTPPMILSGKILPGTFQKDRMPDCFYDAWRRAGRSFSSIRLILHVRKPENLRRPRSGRGVAGINPNFPL